MQGEEEEEYSCEYGNPIYCIQYNPDEEHDLKLIYLTQKLNFHKRIENCKIHKDHCNDLVRYRILN